MRTGKTELVKRCYQTRRFSSLASTALLSALFGGIALLPGESLGAAQYTITDLGTLPGGSGSQAFGINNYGQVVGNVLNGNMYGDMFLYSGGSMHDVGNGDAYAINNGAQFVGYTGSTAFVSSGGSTTSITPGIGFAINDSGTVVGQQYTSGPTPPYPEVAFEYSEGSVTTLGTLSGGTYSLATGINNIGQVVGNSSISGGFTHAFLYSDGAMLDLGTLGGTDSEANAINSSGEVAGWARLSGNNTAHAFICDGGSMHDLGTLPGAFNSEAFGINDAGQVVGFCYMSALGSAGLQDCFVYSDGVMQDLNNLIDPDSGWHLSYAAGINDSGQIVGYGTDPGGQTEAFLLSPIPEPSALAALGIAAAGFSVRRPRRIWSETETGE